MHFLEKNILPLFVGLPRVFQNAQRVANLRIFTTGICHFAARAIESLVRDYL